MLLAWWSRIWKASGRSAGVLRFDHLDRHHSGVTSGLAQMMAEATRVSLERHHDSPIPFELEFRLPSDELMVQWEKPDARMLRAWQSENRATEWAAYCLATSALGHAGYIVVGQSSDGTGADLLVARRDAEGSRFESVLRVEVSGVSRGGKSALRSRVNEKMLQAWRGQSELPAIVCVVGFRTRTIIVRAVPLT